MTFAPGTRVHIIGVGGAGMSALALLLHERGCLVSGSDAVASAVTNGLVERGLTVHVGHDVALVSDAQVVLWSPAVPSTDPELAAARAHGASLMTRAVVQGALAQQYDVWGVTGTHGKTTATSMLAHVCQAAGLDASRLVGAPVRGVGANGHHGTEVLVMEVDESYGSFAEITPAALALLNIEADHLDHYGSVSQLERAFADLIERTRGPVVAWGDDEGVQRCGARVGSTMTMVGRSPNNEWRVENVVLQRQGSSFTLTGAQELAITLSVTGAHNVANAAVVAVLAGSMGVGSDAIVRGLAAFAGAPRRFERRGSWRGVDVIEDYAHLPGEISATIAAARATGYQRPWVVFQPHRVTRTLAVGDGFAPAFDDAQLVIITDLYTAGEANPEGITGEVVARTLWQRRGRDSVRYAPSFVDVVDSLDDCDADVLLVLGAGDVADVVALLPGGIS